MPNATVRRLQLMKEMDKFVVVFTNINNIE